MKNNKPKTRKNQKFKLQQSIISMMLLFLCLQVNSQRLTVSTTGAKILKDGNPITLRGVNFGNWLVWEGYMMNIEPGGNIREKSPTQIRGLFKDLFGNDEAKTVSFENNWRNSYITNSDFAQAKALGYNVVRIPFAYNMFWNQNTGTLTNDGFIWLDKAVTWAKNNNIHVILCLHTAPGYQSTSYTCDNPNGGTPNFWNNWNNVNIAATIWNHIANHYKNFVGNEWIAGYDLLNEPLLDNGNGQKSSLMTSYKVMTARIREVDSNHLIFAQGNYYGSDFYDMLQRWDSNLVFENHYYGPQGQSDPNPDLNLIKGQGAALNIPVWTGEFGENTLDWIRDARIDYDAANVGWAFWAWKRQYTDRSIYSFPGTPKWDALCNYVKFGSAKPSIADAVTATNEICNKSLLSNCNLVSTLQDRLRPIAPIGSVISLQNSGKYVSSNNSVGVVTADRGNVQGWEKFTVVNGGDNKIALRDSNGKYMNSQNGASPVTSNSTAVNGWESFEWINVGQQIALKGFNGKFLSSEGGAISGMNCNRESVSGWESFNYASTTAKLSVEKSQIKDNEFAVYPNPVSDKLNFIVPEGFTKYTAQIFDFTGKQYSITKIDSNETTNSIDTNNLSDGVYILRLDNNLEVKSAIIIKKNH
jgi:endoglucanase